MHRFRILSEFNRSYYNPSYNILKNASELLQFKTPKMNNYSNNF